MNITSKDIMIYKKEYEGKTYYRAGLSRKKQDGSYEKGYIDVKLPKDVELDNQTKINITKGFLSFYKTKDKKDVFYIVVQEYSKKNTEEKQKINEIKQENSTKLYEDFGNQITVDDLDSGMDLPF